MYTNKGIFYVVSTPIGNINDISLRALEILKQVKTIYAEDTRHSANLLQHFNINTPMQSCHSFNEDKKIEQILKQLEAGDDLAIISDAGTPIISDPGFLIARAVVEAGFKVAPIPGASALLSAIVGSGINCNKFCFLGFLSSKRQARFRELTDIAHSRYASIIYEAPHRIVEFLEDAVKALGADRKICLARELTKTYETFITANASELLAIVSADKNQQKGEMVLIIDGYSSENDEVLEQQQIDLATKIIPDLLNYMSPAKASSILAKHLNLNKKQIYQLALDKNAD